MVAGGRNYNLIGRIATNRTAIVRFPACITAGGRLLGNIGHGVIAGGSNFLIGRISTNLAVFIGIPAHLAAGSSLSFHLNQDMLTGCINFILGGISAVYAVLIVIPTGLGAGRCLRQHIFQNMLVGGFFHSGLGTSAQAFPCTVGGIMLMDKLNLRKRFTGCNSIPRLICIITAGEVSI